jgi:hypothetical protein
MFNQRLIIIIICFMHENWSSFTNKAIWSWCILKLLLTKNNYKELISPKLITFLGQVHIGKSPLLQFRKSKKVYKWSFCWLLLLTWHWSRCDFVHHAYCTNGKGYYILWESNSSSTMSHFESWHFLYLSIMIIKKIDFLKIFWIMP